jgi:hypothetical protein
MRLCRAAELHPVSMPTNPLHAPSGGTSVPLDERRYELPYLDRERPVYLKSYDKGGFITFDVLGSQHVLTGERPPSTLEKQEKAFQEYGWGSGWLRWVH